MAVAAAKVVVLVAPEAGGAAAEATEAEAARTVAAARRVEEAWAAAAMAQACAATVAVAAVGSQAAVDLAEVLQAKEAAVARARSPPAPWERRRRCGAEVRCGSRLGARKAAPQWRSGARSGRCRHPSKFFGSASWVSCKCRQRVVATW